MGGNLGMFSTQRVLENRVQRGIFGPKRLEKTGGWRKF
jgi:hypothetical protein